MCIIETKNLSKQFGTTLAVDNVSLQVSKGTIYGFLGLNGAGKTTTMRMLLDMIRPTEGTVRLFGKDQKYNRSVWKKVGYLIESAHAYPNLTVKENLQLFFHYHQLEDKNSVRRIINHLDLTRYQHVKAQYLSLGNLQRLALAQALIHKPELLILDEPINGLDPAGIVEVRQLLKSLSNEGTTIMISSHILSEIVKITDTIGIIHEGRLIKELATRELDKEIEQKLIIDTYNNHDTLTLLEENQISASTNEYNELEITDKRIILSPNRVAELIVSKGMALHKLFLYKEDLESYFLRTVDKNEH